MSGETKITSEFRGMIKAETPRIYLTTQCTLKCEYCSNGADIVAQPPLALERWVEILSELQSPYLIFTGGEPLLYPDLPGLLARLRQQVTIYSNLTLVTEELIKQFKTCQLAWRASCHAKTPEQAMQFVDKVRLLEQAGFNVGCHTVLPSDAVVDVFKERGLKVNIDRFQSKAAPKNKGQVTCKFPRNFRGPDGLRYHCVSKLVRKEVTGVVPSVHKCTLICDESDRCNPCDLAVRRQSAIDTTDTVWNKWYMYWSKRASEQGDTYVGRKGQNAVEQKDRILAHVLGAIDVGYATGLDYGCGVGRFTHMLASRCKKLYAVDLLEAQAIKCAEFADNVVARMIKYPEPLDISDASVNLVWVCTVLQHIVDPDLIKFVGGELKRVLAPGARVVLLEQANNPKRHVATRDPEFYAKLLGFTIETQRQIVIDPGTGDQHWLIKGNV